MNLKELRKELEDAGRTKAKYKHPIIKAIAIAICAYLLGSLTNSIVTVYLGV